MPFVGERIALASIELQDRGDCLCTLDFTALGKDGQGGYFKMQHGTEPAHSEPSFSLIWTDLDGKTYMQDENGVSREVVLAEDEQG